MALYKSSESYKESISYGVAVQNGTQLDILYASSKYMITHKEFLDRANWIYGEGGGYFAYHYAHAIQNMYEINNNSEKMLYYYGMQENYVKEGETVKKIQSINPSDYFMGNWGGKNGGTQQKARYFNELRGKNEQYDEEMYCGSYRLNDKSS